MLAAFGANTAAAAQHYVEYGYSEGRPVDSFDATQYLANYADLQTAFGTDEAAATQHFVNYGFLEGRTDDVLSVATGDTFLYESLTDGSINSVDVIADFDRNIDHIDLAGLNISFDDLFISETGDHTVIEVDDTDFAIWLSGTGYELTEQQFIFQHSVS